MIKLGRFTIERVGKSVVIYNEHGAQYTAIRSQLLEHSEQVMSVFDEIANPVTGKGVYATVTNKFASRITIKGKMVSLGTYDTPTEAEKVYDAVCYILGKPPSSYNNPNHSFNRGYLESVLSMLRDKDVLSLTDVERILNKHTIVSRISGGLTDDSETDVA